jgi:hypothetical protein
MTPALRQILLTPPFTPARLFSAGERGAWFDPSCMECMYQDSAGTTAAAINSPVGLLLDKRYGLARGPELVTNGGFDSGANWTLNATAPATSTISGGKLTLVAPAGEAATAQQNILTIGKSYKVAGTVTVRSGSVKVQMGSGATTTGTLVFTVSGAFSATLVASGSDGNFFLARNAACDADFDNVSVRELPGNHATQATAASRPTLKQDATGRYYLHFDGIDDSLATAAIDFTATDKMTVIAGVHKASDAATAVVLETSTSSSATAGTFALFAPVSAGVGDYQFRSGGSIPGNGKTVTGLAAPVTSVVTGISDIAGDYINMRVNGVLGVVNSADQGTGNYTTQVMNLGRRNNASLPFNGRIYGLIVRGASTTDSQIVRAEKWLAAKTGVTL